MYEYNVQSKTVYQLTEQNPGLDDWFAQTYKIFCNKNNRIYIGTLNGLGMFSDDERLFTPYSKSTSQNIRIKHAFTLLPVADSVVYCGNRKRRILYKSDER